MIVLDLETTGTNPQKHCMLSLGAVHFETGNTFYGECSIYSNSLVDSKALEINGIDIFKHHVGMMQPPHALYLEFVKWAAQFPGLQLLAGHNVGHLDIPFLEAIIDRYELPTAHLPWPFGYRSIDIHSLAFMRFGESMSMSDICRRLDIPPEPKPHHALNGAMREFWILQKLLRSTAKA